MIKRRTTGIMLAVVLLTLGSVQGWPLRIALILVMALSIWEMYGAFIHKGARPARWVGIGYALAVLPTYMTWGLKSLMPLAVVACMVGLAAVMIRGEPDFESAMATLFPLVYPGMMFTLMIPIQDLGGPAIATLALLLTFLVALMGDVMAYEVGTLWGKRRLCPAISPKKSVEGAVAGLVASVAFALLSALGTMLVTEYFPPAQPFRVALPPLWHFALVGLAGGVASQFGDLAASMVKRYCGIKDYGSILPGHGGMMDRIDSVMFNAVVVFVYFELVVKP